jgi:hypothetical protein
VRSSVCPSVCACRYGAKFHALGMNCTLDLCLRPCFHLCCTDEEGLFCFGHHNLGCFLLACSQLLCRVKRVLNLSQVAVLCSRLGPQSTGKKAMSDSIPPVDIRAKYVYMRVRGQDFFMS